MLSAYLEMLPSLRAEEQLEAVDTAAAGSGSMKTADRKQFIKDLRRRAGALRPTKRASAADLQALGIRLEGGDQ